jgi:cell division initiation protein
MKITPLEIRQKQFERTLRGYDKDEVSAFLLSLSQEWERAQDEVKEMRIKLEASEREVTKLREVESSLYKTLKTAEDTGSNMIEQANKAAELHLKESHLEAQAMLNEAKSKAEDTIEVAEVTARQMLDEMEERLKTMVHYYKNLESQRDNLLADLKRLANETMDRVERAKGGTREFDPDQHLAIAKREAKKTLYPNSDFETPTRKSLIPPPADLEMPQPAFVEERKLQKSFFDDIQ